METDTLLGSTFQLLDATELTYPQIEAATGLDRNWLAKLKQRRIAEPGVTKIQRLHDYLAAQPAPPAFRIPMQSA